MNLLLKIILSYQHKLNAVSPNTYSASIIIKFLEKSKVEVLIKENKLLSNI